jgi:enoyl-CoA hydratase
VRHDGSKPGTGGLERKRLEPACFPHRAKRANAEPPCLHMDHRVHSQRSPVPRAVGRKIGQEDVVGQTDEVTQRLGKKLGPDPKVEIGPRAQQPGEGRVGTQRRIWVPVVDVCVDEGEVEGPHSATMRSTAQVLTSARACATLTPMIEIVMDGPGKNSLGAGMMRFLLDRLRDACGAPLLLTGAGDAFSAGLNLKEVAALDATTAEPFLRMLEQCMAALFLYPGPTVAAVNGHAVAGGCVLTLCCDHRVATTSATAKIGLNEVPLGLRLPPRVLAIVRARVPRRYRERVLLCGSLFAPAEACEIGLIDEIAHDPLMLARHRLQQLAASPSEAYAMTKGDLRGVTPQDLASDATLDQWMRESLATWTAGHLKAKIAIVLRR